MINPTTQTMLLHIRIRARSYISERALSEQKLLQGSDPHAHCIGVGIYNRSTKHRCARSGLKHRSY
jgi:hypothetical protein